MEVEAPTTFVSMAMDDDNNDGDAFGLSSDQSASRSSSTVFLGGGTTVDGRGSAEIWTELGGDGSGGRG